MKNILKISLIFMILLSNNIYSQDLYKWSRKCGRLVESHELYFWLKQSQKETGKKKSKIYKNINKKYNSSVAEIKKLIQNEKISAVDKNSFLIRSIYYLNLSNKLLESIDDNIIESKTESFEKFYNNAFESQKEYSVNTINQPNDYDKSKEYNAINLFADLYATDTTNINMKNSYIDLLRKVSINNMKIIDSLEEQLNNNSKNLKIIDKNVHHLLFFTEEVLKSRLSGSVLTHPRFPDEFFMRSKGTLRSVGCKFESMKELLFYNQKITDNNFKDYFQPNIDKAKQILSEYNNVNKKNEINPLDLASSIYRNEGVLEQEIKEKLYKKDDKFYYLNDSVLYEIIEKTDIISFQYHKYYRESRSMDKLVLGGFSMQAHGNNYGAYYKIPDKPTTLYDIFIFTKNRTLEKMKEPQNLIFLTRTDYPTKDINGNPSSMFGNYNFHYVKVKSANKGDVLKVVPRIDYSDTSIDLFTLIDDK